MMRRSKDQSDEMGYREKGSIGYSCEIASESKEMETDDDEGALLVVGGNVKLEVLLDAVIVNPKL